MKAPKLLRLLTLAAGLGFAPFVCGESPLPGLDAARQLNEVFVHVAEKVSPSVVVLAVTFKQPDFAARAATNSDPSNESLSEFWRRFHQQFQDQDEIEIETAEGSGIILRTNGFILTNRHIIQNAEKIEVRLFDGRKFTAVVHGEDAPSDIAVLKIQADHLPVATLGDSSRVQVGEFAIAIGAPFSLDYTATFGHISAKSRSNIVPYHLGGQTMDQDFLQTDANMNPGNSGGPLVNIEGEVIGVNTLIRGMRTGIGFAIPVNLARRVAEQLIEKGRFVRAWLGVEIKGLSEDPAMKARIKGINEGVVVRSIFTNGPAAQSGLRVLDIITAVDGKPVATSRQLRTVVRLKPVDQNLILDVFREGRNIQVPVKPGEYHEPAGTGAR